MKAGVQGFCCAICAQEIVPGGDVSYTKGDFPKPRHPACQEMLCAAAIPAHTWIRAFVQGRGEISMEVCASTEPTKKVHETKAKDLRGTLYLVRSRFGKSGVGVVVGYNGTEIKP